MNLAFLGFAMIIVFMALIMAKKLSPFTSLILVPVAFGLLAGYGWDTLGYAMDGIKSVASTFAMMTFAILYFGVMLTAGMFDPMVDHVVAWCKGGSLKGTGGNGHPGGLRFLRRRRHHHGHDLLYGHDPHL